MTAEQFRRVRALFEELRGIPAAEWERLLADLGDEDVVRIEALSLLRNAADRADETMLVSSKKLLSPASTETKSAAESGLQASIASPVEGLLGTQIGPYRIRGLLGQGGMGAVYEAEHERTRQVVALKLVRPGLATSSMLRRFEFELQVLARLEHPGIARIYHADTADTGAGPQPYFAMELVRGRTLLAYASEQNLNVRQRLDLAARIADAVQCAHQQGVIHRDLKPGNILVTADGQPKILDFGVARAIDSDIQSTTIRTDIGQLVGTLPYMSPEQAGGDPNQIDTRSDVYALGVVIYELLTGRLPYLLERRMIHDAVRIIREEEPTRLSSLNRLLRGDVETIVGKALEKDKARRYQTANALAADIRRHLNDEPIAARPPSATYQLGKFARRNKVLVGGMFSSLALLLAGVVGTSVMLARALAAETEQRRLAGTEAAARRNEADLRRQAEATNQFIRSTLISSDPHKRGNQGFTVVEAMDQAITRLNAGGLSAATGLEADLLLTIAEVLNGNARSQDALQLAERGLRTRQAAFPADHETIANGLHVVAACLASLGRPQEALEKHTLVLEMRRRLFTTAHRSVAASLNDVATCLHSMGRPNEALARLEEALRIQQQVLPADHEDVASTISNISGCLTALGRTSEAVLKYEDALAMRRRLFVGDHPDIALSLNNLGFARDSLGDALAAERLHLVALDMRRRIFHGDHPDVAHSLHNLAASRQSLGKTADAESLFIEALDMRQRLFQGDHQLIADSRNNLANCRFALGRFADAMRDFEIAADMYRRIHGENHPAVATISYNIAECLRGLGRIQEALPMHESTLARRQRLFTGDHPSVAFSLNGVAGCLEQLGRSEEALTKYEDALNMRQRLYTADHPDVAASMNNLAYCLESLGRAAEGLPRYEAAISMYRRLHRGDHQDLARAMNNLAACLQSLGRAAEALPQYESSLEMLTRLFAGDHPQIADGISNVAYCLHHLKRETDALPKFETALEMYQRLFPNDHPDVARAMNNVGNCLVSVGRHQEAVPLFQSALSMRVRVLPAGHPAILSSQISLAKILTTLHRFSDAEPYLLDGISQCLRSKAAHRLHWTSYCRSTAELYSAWHVAEPAEGHDVKAAEWRAKLTEWQATTRPTTTTEATATGMSTETESQSP